LNIFAKQFGKEGRLKRKAFSNQQKARSVLFAQTLYAASAADRDIDENR
jgi:hypothetical protein